MFADNQNTRSKSICIILKSLFNLVQRRFLTSIPTRRSSKPVLDREKCIYCGFCWIYCPEGCFQDMGEEEKYYMADLDYCKGCGICAQECPKDAIVMVVEEV